MTVEVTPALLDEIERVARAATRGRWCHDNHAWSPWVWSPNPDGETVHHYIFKCGSREDADYVTCVYPDVALALVARIRELESAPVPAGPFGMTIGQAATELHDAHVALLMLRHAWHELRFAVLEYKLGACSAEAINAFQAVLNLMPKEGT